MQSFGLPVGLAALISASILNGFAGRTKQKEWAERPLFSFVPSPRPKTSRSEPKLSELVRRIEDIVAPTIIGMGYELVRVAMSRGGGTLQIMIEPPPMATQPGIMSRKAR